ncbi:PQQ-dependent sugar dehydrogenase [Mucilaginibacter sp. KACC 22063]|uniref:PQQ-dependent sugar dehydrogenase n=1 Tax=Mucilaginibacter sp. KACC 22063 TaxID=3025666 RepID=UPI0023667AF9|nr:PQQ-dependent sugar dehydrogenase [Mucilaginibacter sp. KACC 22063]WDF54434.1 PQQ-dependent sugar dehydrogenase [Mucilaginibacter sp. KACC 22063]
MKFAHNYLITGLTVFSVLTACKNKAATDSPATSTDTSKGAPVETKAPNSNYKPAFAGQTRAPGVKTKTELSVSVLNSSLDRPWAICNLPDGRFLITQKGGKLIILTNDGKTSKQVSGLPSVVDDGQGGLLDVNIDPQFSSNRMVYWDYAEQASGGTLLAIAKGKLSADESKLENVQVIYRAQPAYNGGLQFGSRIVFDQQGNLFVTTGERGANDIRVKAQDLSAAIGKVLHLTKDGKAVPGGPFANTPNALPEIYAYGLRSPEGMAWNPQTNELFEAEFGPRGGDEINVIEAGKNYGWPVITYGIEYSGEKVGEGIQQKSGMEQPIYYWDPVISPSGITFYNSDVIPEWKGNLFIGALSGSHICRLVLNGHKVVGEERLLADKGERFRALTVGKDGALYAVTDGGKLYKVAKK